ncbi:fibroblast growth factor receptor 1 [Pocillopora verrucosa]|uniref:fibroblast growth factor receptor 1 n=1 Tax=Pocillopora verrucosa TaxID=203993 RepID=UPI00333FE4A8
MRLIGFYVPFYLFFVPALVTGLSAIQPRQSSATRTEGASFLFEWDFHLQDEDKIELTGFIFGLWVNGYTTHYLMTVTKEGRVIHNPQLSKKLPSYVGRVTWAGNISKSYLAYKLENLTNLDSNTYGCQIDVGGFRRTIHSMITLNVQAINTSKTPELSVSSIWVHTPNAKSSTFVPLLKGGPPAVVRLPFHDIEINDTRFLCTWEYPKDNNGANITMFTVWYRPLLREKWSKVNVTQNRYSVRLNCCLTYEIMVTAWNKKGQSSFDPRTAARVTVLKGANASPKSVLENATARSVTTSNSNILVSNGKAGSAKSKWELGVEYLPYLSILAIPPLLWAVTSRLRRRTRVNKISANENGSVLQYQRVEAETVPMDPVPSWEFRKEDLAIERVVGHGAFGVVSKAYARYLQGYSEWTVVAVKSLQEDAKESEREDLLSELNLLKRLKPHPHVIKLLGCITEEKETPYVIIEYVPYGDLLGYLRRSRGLHDCYYEYPEIKPTTNLTSEQIITFAWQIADGMQYISSKRIIHRDLAARNVLVGDNLRCKITDLEWLAMLI